MYKIILFTHGKLGDGLLDTAEMVSGTIKDVDHIRLLPGDDPDDKFEFVKKTLDRYSKEQTPVLVFTDIFFGTPFNLMLKLSQDYEFAHITGVNLPMLIEALSYRNEANSVLTDLISYFIEIGKNGIVDCNKIA
ncbi:MAG TPA: PTS sugar transporter subunit IIA [Clostridiaceae bacterium]|nr:PTS sugar transporter subunit IIA [Clostridiaceae bacterium]